MPLYIRHSCCIKISQFQTKLTPFYTSPPPLFNIISNYPKPSNPLFHKPFHRPHKIISTFYSSHPTFPHFVAQKKGHTLQCNQFRFSFSFISKRKAMKNIFYDSFILSTHAFNFFSYTGKLSFHHSLQI